jgi:hypothetical protein
MKEGKCNLWPSKRLEIGCPPASPEFFLVASDGTLEYFYP